ncbi:glutathione S-transferase [Tistrella mobilis]|uniref:glutathione transferase n=1 Tax=Tistrella mobilis TaxID=171437 RepID=A0A162KDU0_9PROT|nr:glutathione S-transferase [Tistrella mobilis]KYO51037.1 glutathione S-transferase [Tistrella mobilis]
MIVVHHLNNSRSQRVLWLLEELGLDYEIRRYERDPATMEAPASLKAVHPLGKSPVITDGDVTVAETGAIVDYILERYGEGRLVPAAGTPERLRWRYWMHYAEGSAMPLLVMKLVLMRAPDRTPALIRPLARKITGAINAGFVDPRLNTNLAFWEAELARGPWFAGPDFTTADIMMSFPAEVSAQRIEGARNATRVQDFVKRIHARPAYRRALERGGAYAYAD